MRLFYQATQLFGFVIVELERTSRKKIEKII